MSLLRLTSQVGPYLSVSGEASRRGGGGAESISPTTRLLACIRWLSGGCWSDICARFGIGRTTLYEIIWQAVIAIANSLDTEPGLDTKDPEQLANLSRKFHEACQSNYLPGVHTTVDFVFVVFVFLFFTHFIKHLFLSSGETFYAFD